MRRRSGEPALELASEGAPFYLEPIDERPSGDHLARSALALELVERSGQWFGAEHGDRAFQPVGPCFERGRVAAGLARSDPRELVCTFGQEDPNELAQEVLVACVGE